jgi:hypothetical protein
MQQYLFSANFSAEMKRLFDVSDYRLGDTVNNSIFAANSDSLYSGSPIFRFLTDNLYKYEKRHLACDLPLLVFSIMYFVAKAKEKKSLKEIATESQKK